MVKAKHRYYAKWRTAALTVGFLTLVYVASAHAQGSGYIYWVEAGTSKIRRANLDSTGAQDHITSVNQSEGIALQIAAPARGSSSISGSQEVCYIPFRSKYLLVALVAALGAWLVMRRR